MASTLVEQPAAAVLDAAPEEAPAPPPAAPAPGAELGSAAEANGAPAPAPEPPVKQNLYFVRVPRPHVDDAPVKDLQTKLTATLTKLKEYNSKLAAKREVVAGLRSQVAVARSLKEEAAPEWQDKFSKLQELKDIRKTYQDEIAAIKTAQSGLDVRTEEELDAKVAAMEAEIAHGQMALREEKQMVKDISRLGAQRERVRQAESHKAELTQLEGELSKVKATIKELDTEVSALRGERSQAVGILQEIQGKLREVNDSIQELESERSEVEGKKKELQEQIRSVQDESSGAMQEWRDNRKFSLTVRDLVEAGKLDEAKALCAEQVGTYMARLLDDVPFRKEYTAGWAEQRKYVVSDLLPGSGTAAASDVRGGRDKGGRGAGKGDAAAPRAEPKVQGAVKAAALIEQLMQQAQAKAAAQRGSQPAPPQPEADDGPDSADAGSADGADAGADANGGPHRAPVAAAPRVVPGATDELLAMPKKAAKPKAASAAVIKQAELPVLPDLEFEVPALVVERDAGAGAAALSEQQVKEAVREENRRKAAEADTRKKRREEAAARKKQLAEVRKAEEAAEPAAPVPAPTPLAPSGSVDEAEAPAAAEQQAAAPKASKQQKPQQRKAKVIVKPGPAPLKRTLREEPAWRKALKAVGLDDPARQAVALCVLVMAAVLALWLMTGSATPRRPQRVAV